MTTDARKQLDLAVSEKDFQQSVVDLARRTGWLVHTVYDSRRSPGGWPDLFLLRDGVAYAWELKREADSEQPTPKQIEWLNALADLPWMGKEHVRVMRPSDWDTIEWHLTRPRPGRALW